MGKKLDESLDEVVVLDFETTGLSAQYERVIEVGAALVKGNQVTETFSQLCYPGTSISSFITEFTGITNSMLKGKPKPEIVMSKLHEFIGSRPILAHNASFDRQFLYAEMERAKLEVPNSILCTLLLSRRIILETENHKLGTLKQYIKFNSEESHQDHRALDDVKVTAALWIFLRQEIEKSIGLKNLDVDVFQKICRTPKSQMQAKLKYMAKDLKIPV
jgi:DNA polymerase-3 subunit epsilon